MTEYDVEVAEKGNRMVSKYVGSVMADDPLQAVDLVAKKNMVDPEKLEEGCDIIVSPVNHSHRFRVEDREVTKRY